MLDLWTLTHRLLEYHQNWAIKEISNSRVCDSLSIYETTESPALLSYHIV